MANGNFTIVDLDCVADADVVEYLTRFASAQKSNFRNIYPWEQPCALGDKILVALDDDGERTNIVGWMHVMFSQTDVPERQKYAFVTEVSTISDRTKYRGVGSALFGFLADNFDVDFIQLISLQDARGFYARLGFTTVPGLPYSFKAVRTLPTTTYIEHLIQKRRIEEEGTRTEREDALKDIAAELPAELMNSFWSSATDDIAQEIMLDLFINEGGVKDVIDYLLVQ